jgi:hypothetical protein
MLERYDRKIHMMRTMGDLMAEAVVLASSPPKATKPPLPSLNVNVSPTYPMRNRL